MPSTPQQLQTSAQAFSRVSNFPRVIGAIDGTHVAIKAPSIDEAIYINRKRFHSLNVQVVCDGNGLIINYSARFPGSTHDAYIWRNCNLRHHFSRGTFGDYLLLGDSGYPLEPFIMTPVTNPTNEAEELYNRAHVRTRVVVERTLGIVKNRFRCIHRSGGELQYTPLRSAKIITACLLLHNRCVRRGIPDPNDHLQEEDMPNEAHLGGDGDHGGTGRETRDMIIREFYG
ncbi:hypothetical protein Pcinc_022787 [Petrolisthes cinctipes]|uniref:Putative nuclease HARBI1 n=1 Tax=Petrolisthes cinctipes TaxID=88211 RepID=A0AAE1FEV0_PETCI|nr:hypothetical protein Pcinc_022787 [Petrolisthes cinctipes]